jgi:hypothetical protein
VELHRRRVRLTFGNLSVEVGSIADPTSTESDVLHNNPEL